MTAWAEVLGELAANPDTLVPVLALVFWGVVAITRRSKSPGREGKRARDLGDWVPSCPASRGFEPRRIRP
jgi:hypothetical protein